MAPTDEVKGAEICGTCSLTREEHVGTQGHAFLPTHQYDFHSVSAESRSWLVALSLEPVKWGVNRPMPLALQALVHKGLAFRSALLLSITPKGEEVLERIS